MAAHASERGRSLSLGAREAVALAILAAGCAGPDASKARSWYDVHRTTVERIDRELHAAVAAIPDGPARDEAIRAFRAGVLPSWLALPGVIGVKVEWRTLAETVWQPLGALGLTPGGIMNGRVAAKDGVSYDDRLIGWGEYQTSFENACGRFGDGAGRPGFEAAWDSTEGERAFRAELYVLAEDTVDDAWRKGVACVAPAR